MANPYLTTTVHRAAAKPSTGAERARADAQRRIEEKRRERASAMPAKSQAELAEDTLWAAAGWNDDPPSAPEADLDADRLFAAAGWAA